MNFIMGVFQNYTCPSKWVLFQTFNTHIRVKIIEVAPPGGHGLRLTPGHWGPFTKF